MIWDLLVELGRWLQYIDVSQISYYFEKEPYEEATSAVKKISNADLIKRYKKLKLTYLDLKVEKDRIQKMNDEFIIQGVEILEVIKTKDKKIEELQILINRYEEALIKRDKDNIEMVKILDSYKDKISFLMYEKTKLIESLDQKDVRIKILNTKVIDLKKQNDEFKKEIQNFKKD